MGFWNTKVVPKVKKLFEKDTTKKTAAAEASKSFDESKEEINKLFEEKKEELKPKVLEIYEASPKGVKTAIKESSAASVKKHGKVVNAFLEELAKAEFPGAKEVSELSTKFGPGLVPEPVLFVLEKVASFLPAEEPKPAEPAKEEEKKEEVKEEKKEEITEEKKEEAAEEKKEEVKEEKVEEKKEETAPAPAPAAAAAAPEKVEEVAPPPKD